MNPGKILLVEDNPDDVALTLRALKSHNITNDVVVAEDGAKALDILFGADGKGPAEQELPAVVLLDLKLPKVNGMEVLQRIRADESTRLLPVVILTSSDEERDVIEGYSLGANSYVRKPVDFVEFTQAAKQLGLYWLLMNRAPPVPRRCTPAPYAGRSSAFRSHPARFAAASYVPCRKAMTASSGDGAARTAA